MAFSVRRMLADLKVYARGNLRSKEGFFFTLVFPVILILLFGAIFSGGNSGPATVYVQNLDGGQVSASFIHALNSTTAIILRPVPAGTNFTQYLSSHSSTDGVIIPAGFTPDYLTDHRVNVTVYGDPASTTSAVVFGIATEIVNAFNLHGSSGVIGVTRMTAVSSSYKYIDFLIPGLVGFAALTSPMFAVTNLSSTYRRDKIFKLLSLTPLTKTEWLMSKILWYIGATAVSFLLMSLVGAYLFGAHFTLNWGIIVFLVLGPFFFVSLGMLVGTVSNSPESASVVGNLVTFPMMFLSGTFFPVQSMPAYLQAVAHVLPLYYVIEGLTNVMIYGNFASAYFDMVVVLTLSVVTFALAVRFFRWRED
jgi:ABC-2 type transport system permease protein